MTTTNVRRFAKFMAVETDYTFRFRDDLRGRKLQDFYRDLNSTFRRILDRTDGDLIKVTLKHPALQNPIVVPPQRDLTPRTILDYIEKTLTSHEDQDADELTSVIVGSIRLPSGEKGRGITNLARDLANKKSVVQIKNVDSLCALRAVAVTFCKLNSTSKDEFMTATRDLTGDNLEKVLKTGKCSPSIYRAVRQPDSTQDGEFQRRIAERLARDAGLPLDRPLTIADLDPVEDLLNVNVAVLSADSGNKFVRRPNRPDRRLTGFLGYQYFCEQCCQPYTTKNQHSCSVCYTSCENTDCPVLEEIECPSCRVICRSRACLERHRLPRPRADLTLCETHNRCPLCNKKMPSNRKTLHTCGEYKCPSCTYFVQPGHLCFQRALPPVSPDPPKYVFYDFETCQSRCTNARKATAANPRRTVPTARKTSFVTPAGPVETVSRTSAVDDDTCPIWWWPTPSVPPVKTPPGKPIRNVERAADLCVPDAPVPVPAFPCFAVTSSTRPGTSSFASFPSATRDSLASPTTPRDSTLTWSWTTWSPSPCVP